jgi:hypothetical protein
MKQINKPDVQLFWYACGRPLANHTAVSRQEKLHIGFITCLGELDCLGVQMLSQLLTH